MKIILLIIFTLFNLNTVFGSQNIINKEINTVENNIQLIGVLPTSIENDSFSQLLNEKVDSIYLDKVLRGTSSRAKKIEFDYNVYTDNEYLSIVIKSTIFSATPKTIVNSININTKNNSILNLQSYLGEHIFSTLNTYGKGKKITDETSFYVVNGNLVLTFDYYNDLENSELVFENINTFTIDSDEYYTKDSFNLKMIPMRKYLENLGYEVTWNNLSKSIIVYNDDITITTVLNSDEYYYMEQMFKVLESPVEIKDNVSYVPISFFTEILNISYTVNDDESITFYYLDVKN